jgi:hypothetical protein
MNIISLLVVLLIFGAVLYLINLAPIDDTVKRIIQVIAIVGLIIWFLSHLAPVLGGLSI